MTVEKKIYLIRHGETEWTRAGRHTSHTDLPLTRRGEKEARMIRKEIKHIAFSYVFASSLERAQRTCFLAGLENRMHVDDDLLEWDYGEYEGKTTEEIRESRPGWTIFTGDPPGGETRAQIRARADRLLEKLEQLEGPIALFSSGHISRAIGARWIEQEVEFGKHLVLSTASVSILGFEHHVKTLVAWNE